MVLTIELEQEDDGRWMAEVFDIPGAMAYGTTSTEAKAKAQAIALRVLADRLEHGETTSDLPNIPNNTQVPGDVEIAEGKVNGDEPSFSLMRDIGGTQTKVLWKGKISADEIKFTRTTQGAAGAAGGGRGGAATEVTAKRAK